LLAARDRALETGRVAIVLVLISSPPIARASAKTSVLRLYAERAQRVDRADEERRAEGRQRLRPGAQRLAQSVEKCFKAASLRATDVLRVPRTETAFRCFAPHTAPMPPRPATPSRFFQ
jgi:hypothetical protein